MIPVQRAARRPLALTGDLRGLGPLASPGFRTFWVGNAVSQAGDQMQLVALAVLVLDLTASATALGTVLVAQTIPRTVLMLVGGVVADRRCPRTVLLVASLLQALAVAALAALAGSGSLAPWQLYAYALIAGTLNAFAFPAAQAVVPALVPSDQVRSAVALVTTTFNMTLFVIPPLAGLLVSHAGAAPALALNAASFVVTALCVLRLRIAPTGASPAAADFWAQLRSGVAIVRRTPVLLVATVSATVYSLGYEGVTLVAVPALAKFWLGGGDSDVGLLYGALGVGALIGTLVVVATIRIPRPGLVASLALTGMGCGLAAVAAAPSLGVAALLTFLTGVIRPACTVHYVAIMQTYAPPEARGRVMALFALGAMGLAPLSVGAGGLVADSLGAGGVFLLGGAVIAAAGVYALSQPAFRTIP
jgi:MFS family permease